MYHQNGWVTFHPWVRGNYSISTGILLTWYKLEPLKYTLPEMKQAPLKEGGNGSSGLAYLTPHPSPDAWQCCLPWPTCMVCTPLTQTFGDHLCLLHRSVGHYSTHIAFTKFTQEILNDSQQNLSLLNTEISLWEKLPSKTGRLRTLLRLHEEAPVPLSQQNVVCSYLMGLLMHHSTTSHEDPSEYPEWSDPQPRYLINQLFSSWSSWFIHSPTKWHLGCFQLLGIMNKTAV